MTSLCNLSGSAIPDNARIAIVGAAKTGDVLVIESFDGVSGTARWRTEAELAAKGAGGLPAAPIRPSWLPPLKGRAPYT